jgi:hypothetical protein
MHSVHAIASSKVHHFFHLETAVCGSIPQSVLQRGCVGWPGLGPSGTHCRPAASTITERALLRLYSGQPEVSALLVRVGFPRIGSDDHLDIGTTGLVRCRRTRLAPGGIEALTATLQTTSSPPCRFPLPPTHAAVRRLHARIHTKYPFRGTQLPRLEQRHRRKPPHLGHLCAPTSLTCR